MPRAVVGDEFWMRRWAIPHSEDDPDCDPFADYDRWERDAEPDAVDCDPNQLPFDEHPTDSITHPADAATAQLSDAGHRLEGATQTPGTAEVIPLRAVTGAYARGGALYLQAGYSPLPLPAGQKKPPPEGWTGRDAPMATQAQVLEWCGQRPDANIALRLPPRVIGIDVDAHQGEAAAQAWAELVERRGALPAAPWCSARDDGVSGIRLFR